MLVRFNTVEDAMMDSSQLNDVGVVDTENSDPLARVRRYVSSMVDTDGASIV